MTEMISGMILAAKDVDFYIKGLLKYELFGQELWITTTHVGLLIVTVFLIILMLIGHRKIVKADPMAKPKGLQNVLEIFVETIDNLVESIMGKNGRRFRNWICAIFMFILFCNISGLFGLRPPTADYGVTLPLGLITFLLIQINGLRAKKMQHVTNLFKPNPILFPINLIGEVAVPLSLSLRLFGNIMSGTILMGLIYGLLPKALTIGIPSVIHVYCDIFSGAIQTYVFCMLTMVYINDKIADE